MPPHLTRTTRNESEIFEDLYNICISPGYIHAISFLCSRDNTIQYSNTIKYDDLAYQYRSSRLIRTEISTLIGLMVRAPVNFILPNPETLSGYIERTEALLLEIHHSMSATWLEGIDFTQDPPIRTSPFSTAKNLREPIFYSGESAYGFQYRDLALLKYKADDAWLLGQRGFSIADAVAVVQSLERLQSDRHMATFKAMRDKPLEERTILPAFEFTAEEVADLSGIPPERTDAVLSSFTLTEGHLNTTFTELSEFNATNAAPILTTPTGKYILFQQYSLLESLYESPFFWMGIGDKAYAQTAVKNRGNFTEQFTAERLRSVFGNDRVFTNVTIYRTGGTTFGEIDVLVLFGNRAIIVQAKSKRLTIEARKGNDLRLKDDFKKAVQDAYDQAYLCATAMLNPSLTLKDATGKTIVVPSTLRAILPLCLVSDHYPALAFQARQFLTTSVTDQILSPLVTDVFALDVMVEMLASPLHFLHYLHLRAQFGDKFIASHELTLLSYHLACNLWGDGKYDMMAIEDDISADLDIAMMARRLGMPGPPTPEGLLTKFVNTTYGRLVAQVETSDNIEMTDLGIWLLTLNEQTVRDLGAGIDRITTMTRQDKTRHDISIGVETPASGLTVHCSYDPAPEAMRNVIAHANLRKYSMKAESWYALTVSPKDGSILMGAVAKFPWKQDSVMDKLLTTMPKPASPATFHREVTKRMKIGRNDPCTCGSGRKHKFCCLRR